MRFIPLKRTLGIGLSLAALLAVSYHVWRGPKIPATHPVRGAVIQKVVASGQVVPKIRIKITAQVSGRVDDVMVQEGDKVESHAPLLTFVQDEPAAMVEQAKAGYEQAQAKADQLQGVNARVIREALRQAQERLTKARAAERREMELDKAHATTKEALDQAQSDVRVAQSQVEAAMVQAKAAAPQGSDARIALATVEQSRAALNAAQARLDLYTVRSPLAAQVLERNVEPGDGVQAGSALFVLASLDEPRVKIQVDEKYLSLVQEGQPAMITADAYPGRSFEATVERLAPAVNPERGALEVQLIIPKAPDYVRMDMSVSVEVVTNSAKDVLILPTDAVLDAATDRPFVFAVDHGKVVKKDIRLGLRGDQIIEVTSGVSADDVVLVAKDMLKVGSHVRPDLRG